MLKVKSMLMNNRKMLLYLIFSVIVTVVDVAVVYLLKTFTDLDIVTSNTIGVVLGFIIHYLLSSNAVFDSKYGIKGFAIYLGTFIFGLFLADLIIWIFYHIFRSGFGISKGMSIVLPFFVLYYMRKTLYDKLERKGLRSE